MPNPAIEIEGAGKRYHLGEDFTGSRYLTLRESLLSRARRPRTSATAELWALRDIDLQVAQGEILGVIGQNGAGKSTLLKLLARITEPTTGVLRTRGRVGALLEVGTGFHPELTGRENVFLNASILGMPRREIRRRFDDIVEYAGFGEFLDTPLKRFSTGMRLRLAFAVAAHVRPPVVAVDEILSVGDAAFRATCLETMTELAETGRTVVFVSHDLTTIAQICTRTIWLENGRVTADGPTTDVITAYLSSRSTNRPRTELEASGSGPVRLLGAEVVDADGDIASIVQRSEPFTIRVRLELTTRLPKLDLSLYLVNSRGVMAMYEMFSDTGETSLAKEPGRYVASLSVPPMLASDDYTLGAWAGDYTDDYFQRDLFTFHLWPGRDEPTDEGWRRRVVQPPVTWKVEPDDAA